MVSRIFSILFIISHTVVICDSSTRKVLNEDVDNYPFDKNLYKNVLDPELCRQQVEYIKNNNTLLLARFLDAGLRVPRGIFTGNTVDLGNYYQCLNINEDFNHTRIQGKYCMLQVSFSHENNLPQNLDSTDLNVQRFRLMQRTLRDVNQKKKGYSSSMLMYGSNLDITSKIAPDSLLSDIDLTLAICIPASCSTHEGINSLPINMSEVGLYYKEEYCRLPNDKPWAFVDHVAIVIFSAIGIVTFLSTCCDVYYTKILKNDKQNINSLYFCCSLYTNTRRLLTFTSGPDSLECIDGIRALSMIWVILGHTFYAASFTFRNTIEAFQWSISPNALWMTTGHISVDTFFLLSGLLVVYSTAGKLTGEKLIRNLHMFYLNRLLRMFPILAAVILFEASLYNRVSDGPLWMGPALSVLRCRQYWWSALLHVQNFVNPEQLCVGVTWYLSLDVQLHILSPILLYWVLSPRRNIAWTALAAGLLSVLAASTIYNFYNNFPSGIISPNRPETNYFVYYYINILTRASPFFVGMIFGYLLHIWKGKKLKISMVISIVLWCGSVFILGFILYCMYINTQLDWDNQFADNLINSFMRPLWSVGLGWIILACVKGYGDPINWFLSLHVWKLPARLSYAMYIIHFSIMTAFYYSSVEPLYFSVSNAIFNFFGFLFLTLVLAFLVTVLFDSPFSILIKIFLQTGLRRVIVVAKETTTVFPDNVETISTNPVVIPNEVKSSVQR